MTGSSIHAETFVKNSLIDALTIAWNNHASRVEAQKEICWIFSNLMANGWKSVQMQVLKNEFLMQKLIESVFSTVYSIAKEAAYVLTNIVGLGDEEVIDFAVLNCKLFDVFAKVLEQQS